MFEDYIQDAYAFYQLAQGKNERDAKMYYRASVFCASASLEAFVNVIGDTFNKGNTLDKNEIAFLNDKVVEINTSKGSIEERTKFNSIDGKIKYLIKRFSIPFDTEKNSAWSHFITFKTLRDSLVHPKSITDEKNLEEYKRNIKLGLNANIDLMNTISSKLFGKGLRRNLLDLKL